MHHLQTIQVRSLGRRRPSSSTIKALYGKSGNLCTFPDCDRVNIDEDTNENLSQIAHIRAYNPTGPRYDDTLSEDEINSVDNLLILCRNHHREIDFDNPDKYSVEDLIKMKTQHENKVSEFYEISKEGIQDVIDELERELIEKNELVEKSYNKIAELSDKKKEYRNQCDIYLNGFIDLLGELFPLQLPGIEYGRLERPFEDIPDEIINSIRAKCEKTQLINEDGSPVDICLDLKNDWKAQRVWFMVGNFWFYDYEDEKAFYHYDFLKDINIAINKDTGEPSITKLTYYFNYAYTLGRQERHEEEIKWYDKLTEIDPENYKAWYNKSFAFDKLGQHQESLDCADKSIKINPLYNHGWYAKGVAHMSLEEYGDAVFAFTMTIAIDPDYYEAYTNLGGVFGLIGDFKKEIEIYDKLLEYKTDISDIWHNKGTALSKLGRYKPALDSLNVAIDLEPDKYDSLHNKAFTLQNLQRYEEAIEWYLKAIEIEDRISALNDLAVTYEMVGNEDKTKEAFENLVSKVKNGDISEEPLETIKECLQNAMKFASKNDYGDLLIGSSFVYSDLFPNDEVSRGIQFGRSLYGLNKDREKNDE